MKTNTKRKRKRNDNEPKANWIRKLNETKRSNDITKKTKTNKTGSKTNETETNSSRIQIENEAKTKTTCKNHENETNRIRKRNELKLATNRKRISIESRARTEWIPERNASRNETKTTRKRTNWALTNASSTTASSIDGNTRVRQRILRGGRPGEIKNNAVRVFYWDNLFSMFFIYFNSILDAGLAPWASTRC